MHTENREGIDHERNVESKAFCIPKTLCDNTNCLPINDIHQKQSQTLTKTIQKKEARKKNSFSKEEDEYLIFLVNSIGKNKWTQVAECMKKSHYNRNGRQCRDRYLHYLDPKFNNDKQWNPEEDQNLLRYVSLYGKKWKMLEKIFEGRTEVSLRNRYNLLVRKNIRDYKMHNVKQDIMSDSFSFLDFYKRKKKKSTNKQSSNRNRTTDQKKDYVKIDFNDNDFKDFDFFSFDEEDSNNVDFDEYITY